MGTKKASTRSHRGNNKLMMKSEIRAGMHLVLDGSGSSIWTNPVIIHHKRIISHGQCLVSCSLWAKLIQNRIYFLFTFWRISRAKPILAHIYHPTRKIPYFANSSGSFQFRMSARKASSAKNAKMPRKHLDNTGISIGETLRVMN